MNKSEFQSLLLPVIDDFRQRTYEFWLGHIDADPIVLSVHSQARVECCIEVSAYWDDRSKRDIRVILSIDDGGWRAFLPVTDSFIIAPDGTFVGE